MQVLIRLHHSRSKPPEAAARSRAYGLDLHGYEFRLPITLAYQDVLRLMLTCTHRGTHRTCVQRTNNQTTIRHRQREDHCAAVLLSKGASLVSIGRNPRFWNKSAE